MNKPKIKLFSIFRRKSMSDADDTEAVSARYTGHSGEDEAVRLLRREHMKILERNYKALGHEIDIIARDRDCIVFCEVKTRAIRQNEIGSFISRPAQTVTRQQIKNISIAAKAYIACLKAPCRCRFDIVEVYTARTEDDKIKIIKTNHIKDGFRL